MIPPFLKENCTALLEAAEKLARPVLRKLWDGSWICDIWLGPPDKTALTGKGKTAQEALANATCTEKSC